jgi:hypothetical protein
VYGIKQSQRYNRMLIIPFIPLGIYRRKPRYTALLKLYRYYTGIKYTGIYPYTGIGQPYLLHNLPSAMNYGFVLDGGKDSTFATVHGSISMSMDMLIN